MSTEEYNKMTSNQIEVPSGQYRLLVNKSMRENIYYKFDDLDYVENPYTGRNINMKYAGNAEGSELVVLNGLDSFSRYVINDQDYKILAEGLPENKRMKNILFDVKDIEKSYQFALDLYKVFCKNMPRNMMHLTYYDEYQEERALREGDYYDYGQQIMVDPEHPEEDPDWKYVPNFKILKIKNGFISFAIFYLLFIVVSIICLAAVGIISYTRSISMVANNKDTFSDIRKLGANEAYLHSVLRTLIRKIYILPTIIGCLAMLIWYPLMLWQNDERFSDGEILVIVLGVVLCVGICFYQYIFYSVSIKKARDLIKR